MKGRAEYEAAEAKMIALFKKQKKAGKFKNATRKAIGGLALDFKLLGVKPSFLSKQSWHVECTNLAEFLLIGLVPVGDPDALLPLEHLQAIREAN